VDPDLVAIVREGRLIPAGLDAEELTVSVYDPVGVARSTV
jgi:hypothetical protein